jgi:UDP-galactopyranose mutase
VKTALIIGGGIAGCAAAHQLSLVGGWDVTLVEASPYLGAGNRTHWYGGHPYTFGPRHFLTQNEKVYEFLNKYLPLRSVEDHIFLTYVERDQAFYNFPIHRDDVAVMPDSDEIEGELGRLTVDGVAAAKNLEEYWIASVGERLYDKFIDGYSKKMWGIDNNTLIDDFTWSPKGVTLKEGPRAAWDTAISCYPYSPEGYNPYFDLATADVNKLLLSTRITDYDIPNKTVVIDGQAIRYDIIISTISPDILFDFCHGELPYMGRDIHNIILPQEEVFPEHVYFLYYANDESFTRLVEYKRFTGHKAPTTLIGMEIPSKNGRHYPMPFKSEYDRAEKYFSEMPDGLFSIGRAGSYRYAVDIDDCIAQAMDTAELIR